MHPLLPKVVVVAARVAAKAKAVALMMPKTRLNHVVWCRTKRSRVEGFNVESCASL